LVEIIPQDVKKNRGDDRCPENSERYEEDGRRNEYNDYRDGENDSDG